jgi:hypothetical protein
VTVPLFDAQAGCLGAEAAGQVVPSVALADCLDRLQIARALVRTAPDTLANDLGEANRLLLEACAADARLTPCPIVCPAHAGDLPPEDEQVDRLIAAGARAAVIRPGQDCWSLAPWACRELLAALQHRRLPLVCLERHVPLDLVAQLAERHRGLPLVVAETSYRTVRTLVPLMQAFPNVHLSTGSNFTVPGGIEHLAARCGPGRLLFGTGFPQAEPAMAVTQLLYADLSDRQKAMIGSENLERLLAEVRL